MSMPASARSMARRSRRSPTIGSIPADARPLAPAGSRTIARTWRPDLARWRARWPPVNPDAPVTRSGTLGHDRHRRAEQPEEPDSIKEILDSGCEAPRTDRLVHGNRQHELPVLLPDPKAERCERRVDLGIGKDSIRFRF